jgi:short subunit dehydrogenase-like uncharacterized protein
MAKRELDLLVYGASGFTGRLVARYLAQHAPPGLRWGLGGRSLEKLQDMRAQCVALNPALAALPLVVGEGATISACAAAATAVVSTAGPFSLVGEGVNKLFAMDLTPICSAILWLYLPFLATQRNAALSCAAAYIEHR